MSRRYGLKPIPPMLINWYGRFSGVPAKIVSSGTASTGVSPWSDAADFILCYPINVDVSTPVYKGYWVNGSAAGGNSDVAIYNEDYSYVASTGSVAGATSNVPQSAALSGGSIILSPGRYYLGMSHSATTTNQLVRWSLATGGAGVLQAGGCFKSNAADTPPIGNGTITPADLTNVAFPIFGLVARTVFDV